MQSAHAFYWFTYCVGLPVGEYPPPYCARVSVCGFVCAMSMLTLILQGVSKPTDCNTNPVLWAPRSEAPAPAPPEAVVVIPVDVDVIPVDVGYGSGYGSGGHGYGTLFALEYANPTPCAHLISYLIFSPQACPPCPRCRSRSSCCPLNPASMPRQSCRSR
jgi:hypothetical protein